jgi:hypothetical protein
MCSLCAEGISDEGVYVLMTGFIMIVHKKKSSNTDLHKTGTICMVRKIILEAGLLLHASIKTVH